MFKLGVHYLFLQTYLYPGGAGGLGGFGGCGGRGARGGCGALGGRGGFGGDSGPFGSITSLQLMDSLLITPSKLGLIDIVC